MAARHPRIAGDTPPEVLRFDLRPTSAHPLMRSWAFKRPYVSGQAIKAAFERVIQLRGEEGLDRLLAELATEGEGGGSTEREVPITQPAPKSAPRPAPHFEPAAPNIGARAPHIEPQAPMISEPAPHISASEPAKAPAEAPPAADVSPEPKEPVAVPVSTAQSQASAVAVPDPAPQRQINQVSPPAESVRSAETDIVERAEVPPQTQGQESSAGAQVGTNPVEALASIGADTLRKKQNSLAALLQNEKLFNGSPSTGRNLV